MYWKSKFWVTFNIAGSFVSAFVISKTQDPVIECISVMLLGFGMYSFGVFMALTYYKKGDLYESANS